MSDGKKAIREMYNWEDRRGQNVWTLWDEILGFNDEYFPGWRETPIIFLTNALAGEVGEICNEAKHRIGGGTNKRIPTDEEMLEEAVDVFIYLVLLAENLHKGGQRAFIDAGYRKLKKNAARMNTCDVRIE